MIQPGRGDPMNFDFTEEQALFRDSVRRFAEDHLADGAVARAHTDAFPWDVAARMAAQGLLGITVPVRDGGSGGTLMDAVIAIEQVALVCPRSADVVQAGNFGAIRTFSEYATPEQKKRYLPDLLSGKRVISVAMTEPEAGSAVTELSTSARSDRQGYRISGSKVFTTNSTEAEIFLVYVRFGPGVGGIGSVLVERDAEGFTRGQPSRFMNGEMWQQLYFDDVYVPRENVLLPAGGFKKQITGFNVERIGNTARALALGRHAFNIAKSHAEQRKQFGRTLSQFQGIQWKFAEMLMKLEAGQLLLYKAATGASGGLPSPIETSIAKCFCNRAGYEVADAAMQILGGLGFSEESLVQYCVRRTRGWMIAGGSIEMMLNRIAEGIFDQRFSQRAVDRMQAAQ
jgi:alkylation response protein AidB-like acyl-CoA dehydrogenase